MTNIYAWVSNVMKEEFDLIITNFKGLIYLTLPIGKHMLLSILFQVSIILNCYIKQYLDMGLAQWLSERKSDRCPDFKFWPQSFHSVSQQYPRRK